MKKLYFNWKNYVDSIPVEILEYLSKKENFVVFPPDILVEDSIKFVNSKKIGVQSVNHVSDRLGAYTSQTSITSLTNKNLFGSIVGHSEVRKYYQINFEDCFNQIKFLNKAGLKSVFCVGFSESDDKEKIEEIALEEIAKLDAFIKSEDLDLNLIEIAYEPIWAIGTGKSASVKDIDLFFEQVKSVLDVDLFYGGSVSSKNINQLNESNLIDGYLIGGASIKLDQIKYFFESSN